MATLARAQRIAAEAHPGQTDKAGARFLAHAQPPDDAACYAAALAITTRG